MRAASFIAIALLALILGACEDHHAQVESPVEAVQNLHPLQTRSPSKTKDFDAALDGDGSTVVRSFEECEETADAATCADREAQAHTEHLRKAPRFVDQETCESFYGAGRCEEIPAAQPNVTATAVSVAKRFVPRMQGYVFGRNMAKPVPVYFGRPALCAENPGASGCKGSSQGISAGRPLVPSANGHLSPRSAVNGPQPSRGPATASVSIARPAARPEPVARPAARAEPVARPAPVSRPTTVSTPIRLTASSPAPKVRPRSR